MTKRVPLKSTARVWPQAPSPEQKYRDRKRVRLPDGSYRELVGYGPTRKAATEALYARLRAHEAQTADVTTLTVTQAMAALARHKRSIRGRKARTIHNDLYNYRTYIQQHIGERPVAAVNQAEIQAIQTGITARGKWRTAELVTILLRSIWRHVEKTYASELRRGTATLAIYLDEIEQPTRPPESKFVPADPWTVDELSKFLAAAKATYDKSVSNLYYPLFHTAIAAGLRLGELLGLRRDDLERAAMGHQLAIRGQLTYYAGRHHEETTKSPSGVRRVPIGPELVAVLNAHLEKLEKVAKLSPEWEVNDLMFPSYYGRPIKPNHLYRAKRKLEERLSLPHSRLHDLRGVYTTYVTRELARQGKYSPKLVMRLLGQSHPHRALEFYNRVVGEDLATAVFDPEIGESVDNSVDIDEKARTRNP